MDTLWNWMLGIGTGLLVMSWIPENSQSTIAYAVSTVLIIALVGKGIYEFGKSRAGEP